MNDDLILDCCLYFARCPQQGGAVRHVALCSGDKNLCVKVESVGGTIPDTYPRERGTYTWVRSDRDWDAQSNERVDEPCDRDGAVCWHADGAFE